jgi:hypothetical protein
MERKTRRRHSMRSLARARGSRTSSRRVLSLSRRTARSSPAPIRPSTESATTAASVSRPRWRPSPRSSRAQGTRPRPSSLGFPSIPDSGSTRGSICTTTRSAARERGSRSPRGVRRMCFRSLVAGSPGGARNSTSPGCTSSIPMRRTIRPIRTRTRMRGKSHTQTPR